MITRARRPVPHDDILRAYQLYKSGHSFTACARLIGVTRYVLRNRFADLDPEFATWRERRRADARQYRRDTLLARHG